MASSDFYRERAKTFASLALLASNEGMARLYNQMALQYLAKAEEAEPSAGALPPHAGGGVADESLN
jgi:hypothetical protein